MRQSLQTLLALVAVAVALAIWIALSWQGALLAAAALCGWLFATRRGRQALSVTEVALTTLPARWGASSVIVVGIAGVVGVLVALLAMGEGFRATLAASGSDAVAIVLRAGSQAEVNSVLGHDSVVLLGAQPGVAHDAEDRPLVSPELALMASLPRKGTALDASVQIRGIGAAAWSIRPNARIIEGRKFSSGMRELNVGASAAREFAGLGLGSNVSLNNQNWTVVGIFEAQDSSDSEIWADADIIGSVYRRGSSRTSALVKLIDAGAFDAFKAAVGSNPQLKVDVETTRAYFARQAEGTTTIIRYVGNTVAAIMAIGALFGALNCMYAAVSTRQREIATLRAIGFRGLPVVVSVMLETMLLALAGGVLGALLTWLVFRHYTVSTISQNFNSIVFQFRISPALMWMGLKWALAIGFVGGLFPALRAARLPVTNALRES
ncbi:MAG: ABC transporter permease [Gammaproteobacteria bacterium]|nr:ABC transporter permease [Gammaproteobacteria bacterium]